MQTSVIHGEKQSSVPTALEFWSTQNPEEPENPINWLKVLEDTGIQKDILGAMKIFARMHVKAALEEALDNVPYGSSTDTISYEDVVGILTCYPLTNIK